jgi:potassium efflux system protein
VHRECRVPRASRFGFAIRALNRWLALPLFLSVPCLGPLVAQTPAAHPSELESISLTADQLRAARTRADENPDLAPDVRARIVRSYDAALRYLDAANAFNAEAERFKQEASVSESRISALQKELDQPLPVPVLDLPENATSQQIEEKLTQAGAELAAAREALRSEDQLSAQRAAQRREISARLGTLNQRLLQIDDEVQSVLQTEPQPELRAALQTSLLAQRQSVEAEIAALQAELARHVARAPTLPLRRDRAQRRVLEAQRLTDLLAEAARTRRILETRQQVAEVRKECEDAVLKEPSLAPLAREVTRLVDRLSGSDGIRMKVDQAAAELSATRQSLSEAQQAFETTRRKWEVVRFRGSVLQWWPNVPMSLERPAQLSREIRLRELQIPEIQHQLILLEERRAAAGDIQAQLAATLQGNSAEAGGGNPQELQQLKRELLRTRRELLDELISKSTQYSNLLYDLDNVSQELLAQLNALQEYVMARVLWARSVPGSTIPSLRDTLGAVRWLFANPAWGAAWREALSKTREIPLQSLGALLLVALSFLLRPWFLRRLDRLADLELGREPGTMALTARTTVVTALSAIPLPILLLLLSQFVALAEQYDVARAAAFGIRAAAVIAGTLELIACACRPRGLVELHFGWPPEVASALHRNAHLGLLFILPPAFVSFALREVGLRAHDPLNLQHFNNSLGRICFVLALLALSAFSYRALRPATFALSSLIHAPRWAFRFRPLALFLAVSLSLAPAILASLGFYVTAVVLVYFVFRSFWLAIGLTVLSGFLRRWETLKRQSLARMEMRPPQEGQAGEPGSAEPESPAREIIGNLAVANAQVRNLMRFGIFLTGLLGLFIIWRPFVPALQMLNQIQIWPSVRVLSDQEFAEHSARRIGSAQAPSESAASRSESATATTPKLPGAAGAMASSVAGSESPQTETPPGRLQGQPLMLSELLASILLMVVTTITSKNVPGLLEFSLLPRIRVDAGARAAIGMLVRYAILLVGFSIALAILGLRWSQIQWLAAALTFGLGFGLQEIFANVVSGLIMLLERPVRIGDAVTIGNTSGRVGKIQMRATTIVGWDNSELIVPNKEFITGQLINWTLSDPRVRVVIPVGVAYGTDVQRVKEILLRIARQHPLVLSDPAPEALFIEFGASALQFELRVFINFNDGRPRVTDELNAAIDRAFREHDIVIAFPQMDIHVAPQEDSNHTPEVERPDSK